VQVREEADGQSNVRILADQVARFIGSVADGECDALQPLIGCQLPRMHHLAWVAIMAHDNQVVATLFARQFAQIPCGARSDIEDAGRQTGAAPVCQQLGEQLLGGLNALPDVVPRAQPEKGPIDPTTQQPVALRGILVGVFMNDPGGRPILGGETQASRIAPQQTDQIVAYRHC
jgi:hypothetical protein